MWRAVTDAVGADMRDSLWDYPDLMPSAEDIDDPAALVARLQAHARGEEPVRDAFDDALEALLDEESRDDAADPPADAAPGDEPEDPTGPRPV